MNSTATKKSGSRRVRRNIVGQLTHVQNEMPRHYFLRMTVEFGSAFAEGEDLPRGEFITKLRQGEANWRGGFIGEMMAHFADHLQACADQLSENERDAFMREVIPPIYRNYYEGCGSCKLSSGKAGANCCTVIDHATTVCFCDDAC